MPYPTTDVNLQNLLCASYSFARHRCKRQCFALRSRSATGSSLGRTDSLRVQLSGNLACLEARGLVLSATVAEFSPVLLAFAWTESREAALILGYINFFAEFDVCFYRLDLAFEVRQKKININS